MKTIHLLTIGNSFAENALTYLESMAESAPGLRFVIGRANLGSCSLEKHWNLADYTSRNPEYKTYRLRIPGGGPEEGSLQDALVAQPWNLVILQQVSTLSWRPSTFQPWLDRLHASVTACAPQARILLHQTWAYRTDSPFFPQHGLTQALMHERIRRAYAQYARTFDCGVIPAGEAVHQARQTPERAFRWPDPDFDYVTADAPALPRQEHSLAIGWKWAIHTTPNGIPQLRLDANHLNAHGCYLVGCLWFERLTERDCRAIVFRPDGMDEETAAVLRDTAHAACEDAEGRTG